MYKVELRKKGENLTAIKTMSYEDAFKLVRKVGKLNGYIVKVSKVS